MLADERGEDDTRRPDIVDVEFRKVESRKNGVEKQACEEVDPAETVQTALARLREYVQACLSDSDVEAAMLGTANGLLMKLLIQLDEAIDDVLAESADKSDRLGVLLRGIEAALRLVVQVDRFTRLRLALSDAREAVSALSGK